MPHRAASRLGLWIVLLAATSVLALLVMPTSESVALVSGGDPPATADAAVEPDVEIVMAPPVVTVPAPVAPTTVATTTTAPAKADASASARRTASAAPPAPARQIPASTEPAVIDTGLWIGDGAGPLRQLGSDADWTPLAWSPDSRAVAMGRAGEVVLLEPASGTRRLVLAQPGSAVLRAAWSPDGRQLAVLRMAGTQPKVSVLDLVTAGATEVAVGTPMTGIGYSPQGCLLFGESDSRDGQTGLAMLCPGQPRRFVPLPVRALSAVLPGVGLVSTQDGSNGISVVDFEGRPLVEITSPSSLYGGELAWDQAGGRLIWRGTHGGNRPLVELYASGPGGTVTLSRCSASPPTASANGVIAYADACGTSRAVLRRQVGGGPPDGVATIPYHRAATPLLSPNGRWLIVSVAPFQ